MRCSEPAGASRLPSLRPCAVAELGSFGDMNPRLLNQACWILLMLVSCARPQNQLYPANSARLASKLGISDADWREIQP